MSNFDSATFNQTLIEDLRANGGRATGGPFHGRDVLILTTRGARSGELRESPLVYTKQGGPAFKEYETKTARVIPMVALNRI